MTNNFGSIQEGIPDEIMCPRCGKDLRLANVARYDTCTTEFIFNNRIQTWEEAKVPVNSTRNYFCGSCHKPLLEGCRLVLAYSTKLNS